MHDANALFFAKKLAPANPLGTGQGQGQGLLILALWGFTSLLGGFKGVLRPTPLPSGIKPRGVELRYLS